MMNSKLKMLVNVLPVILVPLIAGRKKIKAHPDIEKLNHVSKSAYTTVKDKSADTAASIKDKSVSAYETGRHTYDVVSDKLSETKQSLQHKKEVRDRMKSIKEKSKERDEASGESADDASLKITEVPKMMKSNASALSNEEKMRGMLVSNHVLKSKPLLLGQGYREVNSQHPVIYDYDKEEWFKDDTLYDEEQLALTTGSFDDKLKLGHTEETKEKDMTHINVQEEFFSRVKDHEENIETFNNSHLFLQHRQNLAPNMKFEEDEPVFEHSALFEKHRILAESHIETLGRKSSVDSNMKRSRNQQKLDGRFKKVR